MKYILMIFLLSCGKPKTAAHQAKCTFSPAYGECVLTNNTAVNLDCKFDSDARTLHGFPITVRRSVFLYPNMSAWNYVRSFNPVFDPIVDVTSTVSCREVR